MSCGNVGSKRDMFKVLLVILVGCLRMPCNVRFVAGTAVAPHTASQQTLGQLQTWCGYGVEPAWYVAFQILRLEWS